MIYCPIMTPFDAQDALIVLNISHDQYKRAIGSQNLKFGLNDEYRNCSRFQKHNFFDFVEYFLSGLGTLNRIANECGFSKDDVLDIFSDWYESAGYDVKKIDKSSLVELFLEEGNLQLVNDSGKVTEIAKQIDYLLRAVVEANNRIENFIFAETGNKITSHLVNPRFPTGTSSSSHCNTSFGL